MEKKRSNIPVIIVITLAAMFLVGITLVGLKMIKKEIDYAEKTEGKYHVAYYDIAPNKVDEFKKNDKFESVYFSDGLGYAKLKNSANKEDLFYVNAMTKEAFDNVALNSLEGKLPTNENEILFLKDKEGYKYKIGDKISLKVGQRKDKDGKILTPVKEIYDTTDGDIRDYEALLKDAKANNNQEEIKEYEEKLKAAKKEKGISDKEKEKTNKIENAKDMEYTIVGFVEESDMTTSLLSMESSPLITFSKSEGFKGNITAYTRYKDLTNWPKITADIIGVNADGFDKYVHNANNYKDDSEYDKILSEIHNGNYKIGMNRHLIEYEAKTCFGKDKLYIEVVIGTIIATAILVFIIVTVQKKKRRY